MKSEVFFRPEVENDIADAFSWYEHCREGLGAEFLMEYRRALAIVQERPLSIARERHGLRVRRLFRFPYLIHFDVVDDTVLIVAVLSACRADTWSGERSRNECGDQLICRSWRNVVRRAS